MRWFLMAGVGTRAGLWFSTAGLTGHGYAEHAIPLPTLRGTPGLPYFFAPYWFLMLVVELEMVYFKLLA